MSHSFEQIRFHKVGEEEGRIQATVDLDPNTVDVTRSIGLFVPKSDGNTVYSKLLVECCINILFDCAQSLSKSISYDKVSPEEFVDRVTEGKGSQHYPKKRKTKHDLDIEMTHQVREIAALLQWITNSASWRDGEYYGFDEVEVVRRLESLKRYSEI